MDWKDKLKVNREGAQEKLDQKAHETIEENWPKVQQLFQEKVGPAALAAAQNDQAMEVLFEVVYAALPFPVHMLVKEPVFVQFCFGHRDRLLPAASTGGTAPA
jgi:hypothetical protein